MYSFLKTDVTSVKIHKDIVLAGIFLRLCIQLNLFRKSFIVNKVTKVKILSVLGIGSSVRIFEKSGSKLSQKLQCLNGQKIYCFVVAESGTKIFVFGGKQFTIISSTAEGSDPAVYSRLFEPIVCNDWLHSAIWIDEDKVVLLTAHNVVQVKLHCLFNLI